MRSAIKIQSISTVQALGAWGHGGAPKKYGALGHYVGGTLQAWKTGKHGGKQGWAKWVGSGRTDFQNQHDSHDALFRKCEGTKWHP
jgi:hypothetical protein